MYALKKTPSFKLVTTLLSLALISCIGFSFKIYNDFEKTKVVLNNEKNAIIKQLRISKDSLEVAISENTSMKTELIIERQKVTNLLEEINSNTLDIATLLKYKAEVNRLKQVVANLSKEKIELKFKNELLKNQRDSTILVLANAKQYNEKLASINESLNLNLKKGSSISVINLKTISGKKNRKGGMEETDKANKVNVLQISFTIVGSKITKPQNKLYYVQIIDCKNNIIGENKSKIFGNQVLNYSYETPIRFSNESMEVIADLELENAEKGVYYVSVYDNNQLASKGTFALR